MSVSRAANSAGRSTSASAAPPFVAAGPPAGGAAEGSRHLSTSADAWTASVTQVSGRREGTRNAGTRDAIIDDRDALLKPDHPDGLPVRGIRQPQSLLTAFRGPEPCRSEPSTEPGAVGASSSRMASATAASSGSASPLARRD